MGEISKIAPIVTKVIRGRLLMQDLGVPACSVWAVGGFVSKKYVYFKITNNIEEKHNKKKSCNWDSNSELLAEGLDLSLLPSSHLVIDGAFSIILYTFFTNICFLKPSQQSYEFKNILVINIEPQIAVKPVCLDSDTP